MGSWMPLLDCELAGNLRLVRDPVSALTTVTVTARASGRDPLGPIISEVMLVKSLTSILTVEDISAKVPTYSSTNRVTRELSPTRTGPVRRGFLRVHPSSSTERPALVRGPVTIPSVARPSVGAPSH